MHDLTQATIDENTKITTSNDSYVFTCHVCDKQARYAYSFDDKEEVFCNGDDFSTKIPVGDVILEIRDALYLKSSDQGKILDAPVDVLENLQALNLLSIQIEDEIAIGLLTDLGLSVLEELK